MYEVDIYIQTDSISPRTLNRCYAYIIECQKKSGKLHRVEGTGEIEATLHQATLTAINEAMERLNRSCTVHIYTEDRFVCNMFASNIDKWAGNGWKTSKGSEIENQDEWKKLWKLTRGQLVRMIPGPHKCTDELKIKMEVNLGTPK